MITAEIFEGMEHPPCQIGRNIGSYVFGLYNKELNDKLIVDSVAEAKQYIGNEANRSAINSAMAYNRTYRGYYIVKVPRKHYSCRGCQSHYLPLSAFSVYPGKNGYKERREQVCKECRRNGTLPKNKLQLTNDELAMGWDKPILTHEDSVKMQFVGKGEEDNFSTAWGFR